MRRVLLSLHMVNVHIPSAAGEHVTSHSAAKVSSLADYPPLHSHLSCVIFSPPFPFLPSPHLHPFRPLPALLGLSLQYLLKPVIAAVICATFRIPPAFSAGFLLVACVAGAQLSSYASFLADADVALSIVVTSLSTFASVALTPPLSALLLGAALPVDMLAMAKSILQVVVLPVSLGLILNTYARPLVDRIRPLLPLMAMVCTSLCIGSPLALSRNLLLSSHGVLLFAPVLCFHLLTFAAGYWLSKLPVFR